jgi:hypothetical protein
MEVQRGGGSARVLLRVSLNGEEEVEEEGVSPE